MRCHSAKPGIVVSATHSVFDFAGNLSIPRSFVLVGRSDTISTALLHTALLPQKVLPKTDMIAGLPGAGRFTIDSTGNACIGTTLPEHLLHVAPTIGAEQVVVSATGADNVFDPSHRLATLGEVAERNTRLEEQNRELQARIADLERQALGNVTTSKEK
jgi:hypothetical protein